MSSRAKARDLAASQSFDPADDRTATPDAVARGPPGADSMKSAASAAKLALVFPVDAIGFDTITGYRTVLTNLFNVRLPRRASICVRDKQMPKYVTIGYADEAGYERTEPQVRDAAPAHDRELVRKRGLGRNGRITRPGSESGR